MTGATVEILGYSEWKDVAEKRYLEAFERGEIDEVECPKCDGYGTIEDEGLETGQTFEANCPKCDGCGVVGSEEGDPTPPASWADYVKAIADDLVAMADWTGRSRAEVLFEHGFEVWSEIGIMTSRYLTASKARIDLPREAGTVRYPQGADHD